MAPAMALPSPFGTAPKCSLGSRPMKKIAFAHASRRDHYKLIADSRLEGIGNRD